MPKNMRYTATLSTVLAKRSTSTTKKLKNSPPPTKTEKPVPPKVCSRKQKREVEWLRLGYVIDYDKLKVHDWFNLHKMLIHKSEVKYAPTGAKNILHMVYGEIIE